jgi:hypothetical protein
MLIFDIVSAAESLDASFGVNQLLFASEKWMAAGTDIQCDFFLCRTGIYPITARASDGNIVVFRMNFLLHVFLTSTIKMAASAAQSPQL